MHPNDLNSKSDTADLDSNRKDCMCQSPIEDAKTDELEKCNTTENSDEVNKDQNAAKDVGGVDGDCIQNNTEDSDADVIDDAGAEEECLYQNTTDKDQNTAKDGGGIDKDCIYQNTAEGGGVEDIYDLIEDAETDKDCHTAKGSDVEDIYDLIEDTETDKGRLYQNTTECNGEVDKENDSGKFDGDQNTVEDSAEDIYQEVIEDADADEECIYQNTTGEVDKDKNTSNDTCGIDGDQNTTEDSDVEDIYQDVIEDAEDCIYQNRTEDAGVYEDCIYQNPTEDTQAGEECIYQNITEHNDEIDKESIYQNIRDKDSIYLNTTEDSDAEDIYGVVDDDSS